jgi:hypothetical protein
MVANRSGQPIVGTTATSSDQRVERSECSFVHSERATRSWVTLPLSASRGTGSALEAVHRRSLAEGFFSDDLAALLSHARGALVAASGGVLWCSCWSC